MRGEPSRDGTSSRDLRRRTPPGVRCQFFERGIWDRYPRLRPRVVLRCRSQWTVSGEARLSERNRAPPSDERKRRRDGNGVDRETAAKLSSNPCPLRGYPLDERRPGSGRGWDRSRDLIPEASSTVRRPLHGGRTRVTGRQRLGHHVTWEKNTLLDDDDDPPKRGAGVIRRLSETWETTRWKPHKTWVLVLENRIVWAASVGCSVPLTVPFRPQGGNGGRV